MALASNSGMLRAFCRIPRLADRRVPGDNERVHASTFSLPALALFTVLLGGCHGPRVAPSPSPAPGVAACPAPAVDVDRWKVVLDSAGLTYRLPESFVEHFDARLPHRTWNSEGKSSGYLWVGFNHSKEFWLTLRRVPSPGMMEMSECIDSIPGRQMLVQAWRTVGGIFRNGRRFDRYDMLALVPIEPGLTVFIGGGGSDPQFQTILLAIARTVRVPTP